MKEGTVKHVSYFNVASTVKDLDKKFADTIDITPLDVEDRLAIPIDWKGTFSFAPGRSLLALTNPASRRQAFVCGTSIICHLRLARYLLA